MIKSNVRMRAIVCSIAFLILGAFQNGFGASSSLQWTKSTPLPEPRAGGATGVIDGRLIIAGGTYWEGTKEHWTQKIFSATTHAFDPATGKWERLPDAPLPFGYAAFATVNNKLYVMGGYTGREVNSAIFALEKKGDAYVWTSVGKMPADRVHARAVSVGNSIYLLGGTTQFEPYDDTGTCCTSKTATSMLMVLDTAQIAKGWSQRASFPGDRRWSFTSETDGRYIWMFGGTFQSEVKDPITDFNEVLRYNLASDQWQRMDPLPDAVRATIPLCALFIKDRILLMSYAKKVWQLDLATLKYSESSPLPEEVAADKFVWFNHQILASGGENNIQGPRKRSEWTFIGRFVSE